MSEDQQAGAGAAAAAHPPYSEAAAAYPPADEFRQGQGWDEQAEGYSEEAEEEEEDEQAAWEAEQEPFYFDEDAEVDAHLRLRAQRRREARGASLCWLIDGVMTYCMMLPLMSVICLTFTHE